MYVMILVTPIVFCLTSEYAGNFTKTAPEGTGVVTGFAMQCGF